MKRPLSPHLSIYRPQITSVLSIAHRLSGLCLIFISPLFLWLLAALASGAEAYQHFLLSIVENRWLKLAVSGATVAFIYHLVNAIRYLIWSFGLGFGLRTVTMSGWTVVVAAMALSYLLLARLWEL